jgi:hypothetical protein
MVIGTGLVKSESAAQIVLFIIAVVLIIVAAVLFMGSAKQPPAPTPEQVVL